LFTLGASGGAARKPAEARQDGVNLRNAFPRRRTNRHPVAGDGQVGGRCLITQAAAELCADFSGFAGNRIDVVELL
jgi:hypothetical protein